MTPRKLYLVDPWAIDESVGYANNISETERRELVGYYEEMVAWSKSSECGQRVEVIRDYAVPAAERFPDGFFDLLYVDTLDTYGGFYNDLCAYAPKMKDDGIIIGDDFYDMRYRVNKGTVWKGDKAKDEAIGLGMINAANDL